MLNTNSNRIKSLFLRAKLLPLRFGVRSLKVSYSKTLIIFGDVYLGKYVGTDTAPLQLLLALLIHPANMQRPFIHKSSL